MKQIIFLVMLGCAAFVNAQNYVTIPDANFAKYLREIIPNAMNGDQIDTSSADVKNLKKIDAEARAIKNLEGIQYFTGLDTLDVGNGYNVPDNIRNTFTTLPKLPENLEELICGNTSLDSLPELPKKLKTLKCYANNLSTLPLLPETLSYLFCEENQLIQLPQLSNSLINIQCHLNRLVELPQLPQNLKYLSCYSNQLNSLPQLPNSLIHLVCALNQITDLPQLPNSLEGLSCQANLLTSLPELPNTLRELFCNENQLSTLPKLSDLLRTLICNTNKLQKLPNLPLLLDELDCSNNLLTSIPEIPNTLTELICNNNQLSSLPKLNNIHILDCKSNNLTSLPNDLSKVFVLDCSKNKIEELPELPKTLYHLNCNSNNLTYLPILPDSLYLFDCSYNNISCFPILPKSLNNVHTNFYYQRYLNISENPFKCLPNYVPLMDSITLKYPLCSDNDPVNNPYKCSNGQYGILGTTTFDSNKNCHKDSSENSLVNIPVVLLDSSNNIISRTYTAINGIYQFSVGANKYKVQIDNSRLPFSALCPKGGDTNIILNDKLIFAKDVNFNLTCKEGFDVGIRSVATTGIVFPGQPHTLHISGGDMSNWFGKDCAKGISGQLQLTVTGPVKFVKSEGQKTPSVNGSVYTFDITDFGNINFTEDFALDFITDTTAKADDQICVVAQITPINGDYNPTNNNYDFCYSVINSHDPNLKEVYPANFKPGYEGYFTYTIHFQNTGNAPAFNIRLLDTLDSAFDLTTFEVMNYSHANRVSLNGNIMNVYFKNIQLQDSTTNEKASHGFIQYRIKPKKAVSETDQIKNTAHIYFDFNEAIVTNTTLSKANKSLASLDQMKKEHFTVYPNPAKNVIHIENISPSSKQTNFVITDIQGKVLYNTTSTFDGKQSIDVSNFNNGIYFIKVETDSYTESVRFVKL